VSLTTSGASPSLALAPDGTMAVLYESTGTGSGSTSLWLQRFTATGAATGAPLALGRGTGLAELAHDGVGYVSIWATPSEILIGQGPNLTVQLRHPVALSGILNQNWFASLAAADGVLGAIWANASDEVFFARIARSRGGTGPLVFRDPPTRISGAGMAGAKVIGAATSTSFLAGWTQTAGPLLLTPIDRSDCP
ncbi:MAG: hypothetical protein OEY14_15090, partial [Myxococcales bacterium]|nr:hypothetical protein [Myxococcales bacterium]